MSELWDNFNQPNICIIGIPEGDDWEEGVEKIFEEIMAKMFKNMTRTKSLRSKSTINPKQKNHE